MDLSKIISIAGKPGLFKIINQSRGGVVVVSLTDGKKMAVGQTQRVSSLSDISVYTLEGDEPLPEIFSKILETTGGEALDIDLKDQEALRGFLLEILPEHDEERVYPSDIKKMVKWYNLLLKKDLLKSEPKDEEPKDEESQKGGEAED
jgi:hypothetical protein